MNRVTWQTEKVYYRSTFRVRSKVSEGFRWGYAGIIFPLADSTTSIFFCSLVNVLFTT